MLVKCEWEKTGRARVRRKKNSALNRDDVGEKVKKKGPALLYPWGGYSQQDITRGPKKKRRVGRFAKRRALLSRGQRTKKENGKR